MEIIAWLLIIANLFGIIVTPFLFGQKRHVQTEYNAIVWIGYVIDALFVVPLALRVLGII